MRVFVLLEVSGFDSDRPRVRGLVTDVEVAGKWDFRSDSLIRYFENFKVDDPELIALINNTYEENHGLRL
jgi:hypothetical protein